MNASQALELLGDTTMATGFVLLAASWIGLRVRPWGDPGWRRGIWRQGDSFRGVGFPLFMTGAILWAAGVLIRLARHLLT